MKLEKSRFYFFYFPPTCDHVIRTQIFTPLQCHVLTPLRKRASELLLFYRRTISLYKIFLIRTYADEILFKYHPNCLYISFSALNSPEILPKARIHLPSYKYNTRKISQCIHTSERKLSVDLTPEIENITHGAWIQISVFLPFVSNVSFYTSRNIQQKHILQ